MPARRKKQATFTKIILAEERVQSGNFGLQSRDNLTYGDDAGVASAQMVTATAQSQR
jgi:hypothetical protein